MATELTPPPSPDVIKPMEAERAVANTGKMRRPRLPDPLLLVNSSHAHQRRSPRLPKHKPESDLLDPNFLDPTRSTSVASRDSGEVSPLSSCYSDIEGSLYVPLSIWQPLCY